MKLSIIIVNYNTNDLIKACVASIKNSQTKSSYEIIVVDNASEPILEKSPDYKLIKNSQNLGFSKANNIGLKASKGEYKLLLNSDTEVKEGAIDKLISFAESNPDVGVVGPKLLNRDGTLQASCFNFPTITRAIRQYWFGEKGILDKFAPKGNIAKVVDSVVGAAMLITSKAFEKVGYLDEKYFMYFEDIDYCKKIKAAGLKVYYLPESEVTHLHGASVKKIDRESSWKKMIPASKSYFGSLKHYIFNGIIWTGQKFGGLLPLFLLTLLMIPTFYQLLRPGFFAMQDDLQAFRIHQMDRCFDDLQIPCRWVPDAGYQYGYPQFNFYPPFVYYLGVAIHSLGFQYIDTVKVLFLAGILLSSFALYLLIKDLFGKWEGLVASVVFSYAPYKAVEVFVRGALSEFWSLVFFPIIFWSSFMLIKNKRTKYLLILSISLAMLLTTHLLMSMIFLPFFGIWAIYWIFKSKNVKVSLLKISISGIIGIGLASFYLLPVIFERKYAHLESLLSGYFDYRQHFVNLYKLFLSREWGYGSSGFPDEKLNLSVGLIPWILAVFAVVLYFIRKKYKENEFLFPLLFLTLVFCIFMVHQRSSFIWSAFPFLSWLQFPWRFLTVVIFLISIVAGFAISFAGKLKYLLGILIITSSVLLGFDFFRPKEWFNISDSDKFSGALWEKQLTISIFDYLPIYATLPPIQKAPTEPEVLEGDAEFSSYKKGSNFQTGVINVNSDSLIRAPLFDFPGMKVSINNNKITHWNDDCRGQEFCLGLVTFEVPRGSYKLRIELTETPIRKIGNILSLASLGIVILILEGRRNEKLSSK